MHFTLTNIFGFFSCTEFGPSTLGVQYTLIDFLSRENSRVNSYKNKGDKINTATILSLTPLIQVGNDYRMTHKH